MKIAFLGFGNVGGALAVKLHGLGHEVILGGDATSASAEKVRARAPGVRVAPAAEAVRDAEVVVLATPFSANTEVLTPLRDALAGKILVDCTNPVGPGLSHGLGSKQSGSEMIQALLPATRVVKAFSIYGFENFEDNSFPGAGVAPVMMFCGNDAAAKARVAELVRELGWDPLDVGGVEQALHLEHMTLLWVRLVRAKGHSPHLVWAALKR